LGQQRGQWGLEVVGRRGEEVVAQARRLFARAHSRGIVDQLAALQNNRGLVCQQADQDQVIVGKDGRVGRVRHQDAQPLATGGDGSGEQRAGTGGGVARRVLGVVARRVLGEQCALLGEGAAGEESVARRFNPLAIRVERRVAELAALGVPQADGGVRRAKRGRNAANELPHDRLGRFEPRQQCRATQKGAQLGFLPGAAQDRRRRKSEEEGQTRGQTAEA
jgi:hypothetical protein